MKRKRLPPFALWLYAAMILWFALSVIAERIRIEVVGEIVSSETTGPDPARPDYRSHTTYRVQGDDGRPPIEYIARGNDPSLQKDLPVGTKLVKQRGKLTYTVNGEVVNDFPLTIYCILCAVAVWLIVLGVVRAKSVGRDAAQRNRTA